MSDDFKNSQEKEGFTPTTPRRTFLTQGTLAASMFMAGAYAKTTSAASQASVKAVGAETESALNSGSFAPPPVGWPGLGPVPLPKIDYTAGPIRPGRISDLHGKKAVVTGAARGIGRAIAVEYAANGADVALLDICGPVSSVADAIPATMEELQETARLIRSYGREALPLKVDIRNAAALKNAADQVMAAFGRIDILVANAGIQGFSPFLECTDKEWEAQIANNLFGTASTLRAFVPKMVPRNYGRVIVVASMQGKHGTKNGSSYSASKWGLIGLVKSVAMEFAAYNIKVNALLPGLVGTALTLNEQRLTEVLAEVGKASVQKVQYPLKAVTAWNDRARREVIPVGWLQPEDISPMAVFLASDGAAVATGGEYTITGGDAASLS